MTDERRSLYERATAAAAAGEIVAPDRRPTLRTEETYETDENIIVQAVRAQREMRRTVEEQDDEIERLRAENERLRLQQQAHWDATQDFIWEMTLIPIAEAAGVPLVGPDGNKRQFQVVDDVVAEIERLRTLIRRGARAMPYGILQLREPYAGEDRRD